MKDKIILEKNKSMYFVLPLTFIPKSYFDKAINFFALSAHRPELDNHIFVLFEKDLLIDYELSRFQNFSTFEDVEYFGDYVLVIFKLPPYFKADRDLFLIGAYSKYSEKAKDAIGEHLPKKIKVDNKWVVSNSFKILYPTKKDREELGKALDVKLDPDSEIYSVPDLDKETFNIKDYYEIFSILDGN
jgi:hypothetical protein